HYALKSYDEARDAFARVLAMDPGNESAKKGLLAVEENRGRVTGAR
ncbi:MAG: hypothetical protein HYY04_02415, partial [Chloroflexi bacterium]|nr:hypothetical protein [Chloroflexota bacterium]